MPPKADNKTLVAIKLGYGQLHQDILSAVANGDGKHIVDATPPAMWPEACPMRAERDRRAEHAKLGIPKQPVRDTIPHKDRGRDRYTDRQKGPHNSGGRDGLGSHFNGPDNGEGRNKNKAEGLQKGIFSRNDLNKGLGVSGNTAVPSFDF